MNAPVKILVLVVEDNPMVRESLVLYLKTLDINLASAGNYTDALEILKESNVDAIVTDYGLVGAFTGLHLLRKAAEICPNSLRILFTGGDTEKIGTPPEAHHFLSKPITGSSLANILKARWPSFPYVE